MVTVAITGVSGYIGSRLLAHLEGVAEIERVVGIDLTPPTIPSTKLKFYQHNVVNPMDTIFQRERVEAAVHLAFVVRPRQDRDRAQLINIEGTRNFLQACLNATVQYVLYLSSHTVYGAHPHNPIPITEETPLRPHHNFQYSWDKARSEALFHEFARIHPKVSMAVVRACVVLGPALENPVARSLFQPMMVRVAGYNPPLQFIHQDDLTTLMATLLVRRQRGIFNAAGEGTITYRELAALAGRKSFPLPRALLRFLLASTWTLHLQGQSPPEGLKFIMHPIVLSTEKLKREVGFAFQHISREAVAAYLNIEKNEARPDPASARPG